MFGRLCNTHIYHSNKYHNIMSTICIPDTPAPDAPDLTSPSAAMKREFVQYIDSELDGVKVPMLSHLKGDVTNRYSNDAPVRSQSA